MKRGFTLVELMMAVVLMAVLLTPVFVILSSGTKSSLQGLMQIDTTLEGRRIIRQIHQDLKLACIETGPGKVDLVFGDICKNTAIAPLADYTLLRFPGRAAPEKIAPPHAPRFLTRVQYRLEKVSDPRIPFMRLIRKETPHPQTGEAATEHVLSDRVSFFEIKPCRLTPGGVEQYVFLVTLQIVDSPRGPLLEKFSPGTLVTNRTHGVVMAEFFDVVCPDFFTAYWNQPFLVRNHYSGGVAPP